MTTENQRTPEDLSRNSGMTPIDNLQPDLSEEAHELDETAGPLPSQDGDRASGTTTENRRTYGTTGNDLGKTRRK